MKRILQWKSVDGWHDVMPQDLMEVSQDLSFPLSAETKLLRRARAVLSEQDYLAVIVRFGPADRTVEWKRAQERHRILEREAGL